MVTELLELSRIESGRLSLDLKPVAPCDLLISASGRMQMQAERAGLTLRVECAEDLNKVKIDSQRLEQVLVNLIHNSVKFTRVGGEIVLCGDVVPEGGTGIGEIRFRRSRYRRRHPGRRHLKNIRTLLSSSINPEQAVGLAWACPSRNISWKRTGAGSGRKASKGGGVRFIFRSP